MQSGELLVKIKKEGPTDQDGDYEMRLATVDECTEIRPGASPEDADVYTSIASAALERQHNRAFVITMTPPRKNPFFLSAETCDFSNPAMITIWQGSVSEDYKLKDINGKHVNVALFDRGTQSALERTRLN